MKKSGHYTIEQKAGSAFTLIELLVVISIIAILMSILLTSLAIAWDRAKELFAVEETIDEENKVYLEIHELFDRKPYEGLYMIPIEPPKDYQDSIMSLKSPHPKGMELVYRKGDLWRGHYLKWRPRIDQIGEHIVTIFFEAEKTVEQKFIVYVFNEEILKKQLEEEEKEEEEDKGGY
jgi:prepilin-type N-terminal cleavage/methylation domain-containing protein